MNTKNNKEYYGGLAKFIVKETKLNKKKKYIDIGWRGYLLFDEQFIKSKNLYGLDMSLDKISCKSKTT